MMSRCWNRGHRQRAEAGLRVGATYFEKGFKLDPKNLAFALGLVRQEIQDGHVDRAEAVLRRAYQAVPSNELAFYLAENLISQGKLEGKDQAAGFIGLLQNAGFGDSLVRFLEAQAVFQQKNWKEAIPRLRQPGRSGKPIPKLIVQLDLMLAECYGRAGDEEQRLEALRRAAEGGRRPESARVGLAQALARSGKLDQAAATLLPLVEQRPEWRLDLVRLLLQWTIRQPRDRRNWPEVERSLREAEKGCPQSVEPLTLLRLDLLVAQDRLEEARGLLERSWPRTPTSSLSAGSGQTDSASLAR